MNELHAFRIFFANCFGNEVPTNVLRHTKFGPESGGYAVVVKANLQ